MHLASLSHLDSHKIDLCVPEVPFGHARATFELPWDSPAQERSMREKEGREIMVCSPCLSCSALQDVSLEASNKVLL